MKVCKKDLIEAIERLSDDKYIDLVKLFNDQFISARDLYYAIEVDFFLNKNHIEHFLPEKYIEDFIVLSNKDTDFINEIKNEISVIVYNYDSAVQISDFLEDLKEVVIKEVVIGNIKSFKDID